MLLTLTPLLLISLAALTELLIEQPNYFHWPSDNSEWFEYMHNRCVRPIVQTKGFERYHMDFESFRFSKMNKYLFSLNSYSALKNVKNISAFPRGICTPELSDMCYQLKP